MVRYKRAREDLKHSKIGVMKFNDPIEKTAYLFSQSTLKTPVRILRSNPGGRTQRTMGPSLLDSEASLQNP